MTTLALFLKLLRYELFEEALTKDTKESINMSSFRDVYFLAKAHDLGHLIFDAAKKNQVIPSATTQEEKNFLKEVRSSKDLAVMRDMTKQYEMEHIEQVFQDNAIPFLPLKGAVIRNYYPETWMRTSADIDILVHEKDLKIATKLLVAEGYQTDGKKNHHDVSFMLQNVHLELHYNACMDDGRTNDLLLHVWDYAVLADRYKYSQQPEFFVFYFISHMAKHFYHGGSGVRALVDLFIFSQKLKYKEEKVLSMCREVGLDTFYLAAVKLSNVWFGKEEQDEITKAMQDYILRCGIYGTEESSLIATAMNSGGKFQSIMHYIFMPYSSLKINYPVLVKHRWLTPIFEVVRWISAIFKGRAGKAAKRIKKLETQSNEKIETTKILFDKLGLNS